MTAALYTLAVAALLMGIVGAAVYEMDFGPGHEGAFLAAFCASIAYSLGALWFVLWLVRIVRPDL